MLKNFKKRIASFVLIFVLILVTVPGGTTQANTDVSVTIDGVPVTFADQPPVIIDGRTLVPVRGVFENLGFVVGWDDETQTAILVRHDYTVMIPIGSDTFTANGVIHRLDVPARLISGRTMLPIRLPLESIGYHVDWDENTRTVVITTTAVPAAYPAPFPGTIAIVTTVREQNEEEYSSAEALVRRYGSDRVIHRTWPYYFAFESERMRLILMELASKPDVGAIIINRAVVGTVAAIEAAREINPELFIVVAAPAEHPRDVSTAVDLALDVNTAAMGEAFVVQAVTMGAEAIAHISFPRHMAVPTLASHRDAMAAAAAAAGISFHDLNSHDPMFDEDGLPAAQLFIAENVGRWVEEFGVNTAFFATNCGQNIPLLQQVLAYGAMYVRPCCPSPFHAFPEAFGIPTHERTGMYYADGSAILRLRDVTEVIEDTRRTIDAAGMRGRFSNWMLPPAFVWTTVGFYYAAEWLNGDLIQNPGDTPDMELIHRLIGDYMESIFGSRYYMELTNLEITFRTLTDRFPTFVVGTLPHLVY